MKKTSYEYGYDFEDEDVVQVEKHPLKPVRNKVEQPIKESLEMKLETVLAQFTNDVHEIVYNDKKFDLGKIEKVLLKNLLLRFNNTETAKLSGLSIRTIRNKKVMHGLREAI